VQEVGRRLSAAGVLTRRGQRRWDATTLVGMLRNPAYTGMAAFGKTRVQATTPRLRPPRGQTVAPKRVSGKLDVPEAEWIGIPVPALVEAGVFAAVAEQLQENQRRARQSRRGASYLLQGLVVCAQCGYAYIGLARRRAGAAVESRSRYYRCTGCDRKTDAGERVSRSVRKSLRRSV